jgi:mannose-6-phosphate isomerase-like protein (cupin superfamily)
MTAARSLRTYPIHLGLDARAEAQPAFTGMEWYEAYVQRNAADGSEGRLVSYYDFSENWDGWEMHPEGDEVVVCTHGTITLIQEERDGSHHSVTLNAGDYAINPRGVWHTADVAGPASALFITSGMDTQHRPR